MKLLLALALWVGLSTIAPAQSPDLAAKPSRPLPAVRQVVIISVDGLRPDCLLLADAPVLHGLIKNGAYTMWARTIPAAVTLPSHTSMLTGVTLEKHGIGWNGIPTPGEPAHPQVPTIFELAARAGYQTAMIAGKTKFGALNKPGTVTFVSIQGDAKGTDENVAAEAVKIIGRHKPDLLFIHFPGVDGAGHAHGWGSPEQLSAITALDRHLGVVLAALEQAALRASTAIIISADHGGAGLKHGPDDAPSRHIPWIVVGPGVRHGFDLTRIGKLQVNTEDTCATACWLLGLERPAYFDGKALVEAFEPGP
ncbi:MAG: ectonucleotide pyrophosphatase/phosphodiesterase [Opitutaceae bacterium]|nr:ectonucleotide pyrophosphatase/phosphodiesterase [Opitutaceae bacterium]